MQVVVDYYCRSWNKNKDEFGNALYYTMVRISLSWRMLLDGELEESARIDQGDSDAELQYAD